jgi:antitoxin (DNA-binding transcriptional repressor) of toxin-antitoxin stability system
VIWMSRTRLGRQRGRGQTWGRNAIIPGVDPRVLRVNEADVLHDLAAILKRVQAGAEVVIERDAQPLAVIRAAAPARRTISECIALAEAHEKETGQTPVLDPDFAADVEEIVRNRKQRNPPAWD